MSVRKEIISWGRVVCVCGGGVFLAVQYFGTFAIMGILATNERNRLPGTSRLGVAFGFLEMGVTLIY